MWPHLEKKPCSCSSLLTVLWIALYVELLLSALACFSTFSIADLNWSMNCVRTASSSLPSESSCGIPFSLMLCWTYFALRQSVDQAQCHDHGKTAAGHCAWWGPCSPAADHVLGPRAESCGTPFLLCWRQQFFLWNPATDNCSRLNAEYCSRPLPCAVLCCRQQFFH